MSVFSSIQCIFSKCNFKSFSTTLRTFSEMFYTFIILILFCVLISFYEDSIYTYVESRLSTSLFVIYTWIFFLFPSFHLYLWTFFLLFTLYFPLRIFKSFLKQSLLLCLIWPLLFLLFIIISWVLLKHFLTFLMLIYVIFIGFIIFLISFI